MTSEPSSAAKRINKKINEYIEENGMISDLEIEHIINAELATEREAASRLIHAARDRIRYGCSDTCSARLTPGYPCSCKNAELNAAILSYERLSR